MIFPNSGIKNQHDEANRIYFRSGMKIFNLGLTQHMIHKAHWNVQIVNIFVRNLYSFHLLLYVFHTDKVSKNYFAIENVL